MGLYTPGLESDACGVGLIANLKAKSAHSIIDSALTMLENMKHRGACGAEENSGDGAGILCDIPHDFFLKLAKEEGLKLPKKGEYAVAVFFMPKDVLSRQYCAAVIEKYLSRSGLSVLMKRKVPVDRAEIGTTALSTEPGIEQWLILNSLSEKETNIEHELFYLRTRILNEIYQNGEELVDRFYVSSFSFKTIVYKGQLTADQLRSYFPDLRDPDFKASMVMIHSRFSTNTIPKWKLAQPFSCIAHNGEINTIKGNLNSWKAREQSFKNVGGRYKKLASMSPICDRGNSDSGNFNQVLEALRYCDFSIPQAITMMMPEAWQNDKEMTPEKVAFYEYHERMMEPWDGPAAVCFSDGTIIGAKLDRNGLRPLRFSITDNDLFILASEAGCLPEKEYQIIKKGRLSPGEIIYADLRRKKVIYDAEIKEELFKEKDYRGWIEENNIDLSSRTVKTKDPLNLMEEEDLRAKQIAFGFTAEDEKLILSAMSSKAKEPIGSMGADIPLAILSRYPQHLANYFKQQFAQVTNPPIDPLREQFYMSLKTSLGEQRSILDRLHERSGFVRLESPVLSGKQFQDLKSIDKALWFVDVSLAFDLSETLEVALQRIGRTVEEIGDRFTCICLTDRALSSVKMCVPSLLATGYIHQLLIRKGLRKNVSLIIEGGDIWETQHFASLISYGADAIFPYLAYESIAYLNNGKELNKIHELRDSYKLAAENGLLKIMSKLGISTLNSYRGAQTFEVLGLSQKVVMQCFKGSVSRIGGLDYDGLQRELFEKHREAFASDEIKRPVNRGLFQWTRKGEYHLFNPKSIHLLQHATKLNDYTKYKSFTKELDSLSVNASTLRSFLQIKDGVSSIPLSEVEPVEEILKRFASGAMSFGSLSYEAHTTLAIAMNRIGAKSNSGEGGEDPERFHLSENGENLNSAIKQVASGRFGVNAAYLASAKQIQIKMAQGAKPGEGGQLPGHKVDERIARVRNSTAGVGLISPPPHHDIYSIEDLAQLIFDLKNANQKADISVKLVSKAGVGVIASGVAKGHADHILISGADGGTGASPLSSIRHAGLPWELGLAETHQTLVKNGLRDRVVLQADGQIRTGRDLAIATMLGAEEWGVATAALVVEGCILMRKCHLNSCPVGIATQDEKLTKLFNGKADHLVNYFNFLAEDLREIMSELGVRTVNELVGRTEFLELREDSSHWKSKTIDLSTLLFKFSGPQGSTLYASKQQDHGLQNVLDQQLLNYLNQWNWDTGVFSHPVPVKNTDRAVGTILSSVMQDKLKSEVHPAHSIHIPFSGSAGQSFAAFTSEQFHFTLEGEANDFFAKGLSGALIALYPDRKSNYKAEDNTIVGNVCLYGATSGNVFINGKAGDRFCVRNSGAHAVVEGIGDNGCEYMTGGSVVILGTVGRNFAAGMSGGVAYLYRNDMGKALQINNDSLLSLSPQEDELNFLKEQLEGQLRHTASRKASIILQKWETEKYKFLKLIPKEYKEALERKTLSNVPASARQDQDKWKSYGSKGTV